MQKTKEFLELIREFLHIIVLAVAMVALINGCHNSAVLHDDNTALLNFVRAQNYITEHEELPVSQEVESPPEEVEEIDE